MANSQPLVLMWVDQGISEPGTNLELKKRFSAVHPRISEWIYYDSGDHFGKYVMNNPNVKIVAIMSGSLAKQRVSPVSHQESLHSVYVFCGNLSKYQNLPQEEPKIKGVYNDDNELFRRMQADLQREFP